MSLRISNFPISKFLHLCKWTSLYIQRRKLSIEYCLKLSSCTRNPKYGSVFESKFKRFFDRKPKQIPPLGIWVEPGLQAVGYKKQDTLQYSFSADAPWLLKRPHINFSLHSSYKEDTPPEIFLNKFYELCDEYKGFWRSMLFLETKRWRYKPRECRIERRRRAEGDGVWGGGVPLSAGGGGPLPRKIFIFRAQNG